MVHKPRGAPCSWQQLGTTALCGDLVIAPANSVVSSATSAAPANAAIPGSTLVRCLSLDAAPIQVRLDLRLDVLLQAFQALLGNETPGLS